MDWAVLHFDPAVKPDHLAARLDIDLAAAFDGDVLALDGMVPSFFIVMLALPGLDRDLIAGIDHQVLGDLERVVLADLVDAVARRP